MGCRDDILSFFYPLPHSLLDRPPGFLNGLQPLAPSGTRLGALGTIWNYLERAKRTWNARRAIMYCSLAGDNISVLFSLERPSGPFGTREAHLERLRATGTAAGYWNGLRAPETARSAILSLIHALHARLWITRVCVRW